jgi:hypothetical protein
MADIGSILVADCGSTMTTVALIERVHGHYRLAARGEAISTHRPPWSSAAVGVREAIRQIEELVGRRLLGQTGALMRPRIPAGDGVDGFVAVSSAGRPMRVALAGLTRDLSLASAQRAVAGTYALMTGTMALDEGTAQRDPDVRIQTLRQAQPDIILIAGGADGGAARPVLDLAQVVALYNQVLEPEDRPLTFYAGNARLAGDVTALFSGGGELRSVANVRPRLNRENLEPLQSELDAIYQERWLAQVPGFDTLSEWSGGAVLPAARTFGQTIRYIGDRYQLNAVGVDLGSTSTLVAVRLPRSSSEPGSRGGLTTCADLGIGLNVKAVLGQVPLEAIIRWLPFEMSPGQARDELLNKGLHPASVPQTWEDLQLEYALAREAMRRAVAQARPGWLPSVPGGPSSPAHGPRWDLIIGAGRTLTRTPQPGYTALLLLDALEPAGVSKMAFDVGGVAATLGALAARHPLAAVDVVEYDAFLNLGTVVAPFGTAQPGEVALRVKVNYPDGRVTQREVAYGSLSVIPLGPGERAQLELHPTRRFDVGLSEPGRGATAEAEGGILGIVVDARGRPLSLPSDGKKRCELAQRWLAELGLSPAKEVD